MLNLIDGHAGDVPYLVRPPRDRRHHAPLVLAWHLMDAPRTPVAFASAVPLDGLDAWRVYIGLPLTGERIPAGGPEEVMRLGYEDAVMNLYGVIADHAHTETAAVLADLRKRFAIDPSATGVMGGSIGAAVAGLALSESDLEISAAVLISPVVQLRGTVTATGRALGFEYPWHPAADAVADRLDLVARADAVAAHDQPAVLCLVGTEDAPELPTSAEAFIKALQQRYDDPRCAAMHYIDGMGHALAPEPGMDAAPPLPAAVPVDALAAGWFAEHLAG